MNSKQKRSKRTSLRRLGSGPVLDLNNYVPGLFTLIASRLSGGASTDYLSLYGVGIETWRVMVMLANEGRISAQRMVQLIDADKGAISRTFKSMQQQNLLDFEPDLSDRRIRYAVFTSAGRALHDRIIRLALLREEMTLSVLNDEEVEKLRDLLRRIYLNLDEVDVASQAFVRKERATLGLSEGAPGLRRRGAKPNTAYAPPNTSRAIKQKALKRKT